MSAEARGAEAEPWGAQPVTEQRSGLFGEIIMTALRFAPVALLVALSLSACGHNMQQRAATGAIAGAVVAGPVGAVAGAAVGAVVDTAAKPK